MSSTQQKRLSPKYPIPLRNACANLGVGVPHTRLAAQVPVWKTPLGGSFLALGGIAALVGGVSAIVLLMFLAAPGDKTENIWSGDRGAGDLCDTQV